MAERFRLLSQRMSGVSPGADTLHEGVPDHLASSVELFVRDACQSYDYVTGSHQPDPSRLRAVERAVVVTLNWQSSFHALSMLVALTRTDQGLDIIDYLVNAHGDSALTRQLGDALTEAGSAWRVTSDYDGLERRVDETVTGAAAMAMQLGKAGQHLARAWSAAYGVSPDPSAAYSHSIKAVEVAASAIVLPNDSLATLGKMVAELRAQSAKYEFAIAGSGDIASKGDTEAVAIVRLMAQLLWTGQHDRHGSVDPSRPVSVSQREAEAAVHLAAALVQWFESGAIAAR